MHSPDHNQLSALPHPLTLSLPDEAATTMLGRELAPLLTPGMVVWLDGDLGAGKTTLSRALLRALGHRGPVKSPTYTLVEVYVVSSIYWYHFDFYRFNHPEEFDDAGLGEYFRDDAVCLVEWPEKAAGHVPPADLVLVFRFSGSGRELDLVAGSAAGRQCLSALQSRWPGAVG
ncbi:MAG: tRNA (adenosine(37)-N6)-threonylcarbamoyltransferase complex ATPase subunit type 1 TsaE [Rhodocyclaceae bacterium]